MKKIFAILAASLAIAGSLQAQELANFNFGGRGMRPVISPEIQNDSVTFSAASRGMAGFWACVTVATQAIAIIKSVFFILKLFSY